MSRRQLSREGIRYVIVGAWNTFFGIAAFAVLWVLLRDTVRYGWVLLIAQIVAVLQAYYSQRTFVWRSRGSWIPELGRFALVYIATYFANLGLLAACVEWLRWQVLPSQIGITFLFVAVTFFVNRTWTFRQRHGPPEPRSDPSGDPAASLDSQA